VVAARLKRFYATFAQLIHEIAKFGVVGAINYVVDVGLFNLLVAGSLHHKPLTAKAISTTVAVTFSYFLNRHWTWRDRARAGLIREYGTFIGLSIVALLITLGCLAFGEYGLHENSLLARNFWGNIVGIGLATIWRFWSFRRWVFKESGPQRSETAAHEALV
jgi:putative flippase GtrA